MSVTRETRDLQVKERFDRETADHEMTVLRDDGLYRHLRFRQPGTVIYGYDLVTWPGYLAIVGDCGDFVFARVADMIEFFEADRGRINPQYWSEKLQAPRPDGAEQFSEDAYRASVKDWLDDTIEWGDLDDQAANELRGAVDEQLLHHDLNEYEAGRLLNEFEHDGRHIIDAWEWRLREYSWQFLWCCWAIAKGVERYRAARNGSPASGDER